MKKIICSFLLLTLAVKAQTFSVIKGDEFEVGSKGYNYSLWLTGDSIYAYYIKTKTGYNEAPYFIQKLDGNTGKILFEKELLPQGVTSFDYVHNKFGKILLFYTVTDGRHRSFYLQQFDNRTYTPQGGPLLLHELTDTKAQAVSFNTLDFDISFSPDDSKMLVVSELKEGGKNLQVVKGVLYDLKAGKQTWEKTAPGTYSNSTISSFGYSIDNSGNWTYLFKYAYDKEDNHYSYGLGIITSTSTEAKTYAIPFNGKDLRNVNLKQVGGKYLCFGRFRNNEKGPEDRIGAYFIVIDPVKAQVVSESFEYIPNEIDAKLSYNGSRSGAKTFSHYKLVELNNSYYMILHHNSKTEYLMEFLVFKYNSAYKLEWVKMIPRNTNVDFDYSQYMVGKDKIYFLYIDNPQNLETEIEAFNADKYKKTKGLKESVLIWASIDDKGNIKRGTIPTEGNLTLEKDFNSYIKKQQSLQVTSETEKKRRRHDVIRFTE